MPGVVTGKPFSVGGTRGKGRCDGRGCHEHGPGDGDASLDADGRGQGCGAGVRERGSVAAKMLQDQGCKVVAISDASAGSTTNRDWM